MKHRRILIVGADGLRPDLVDPVVMPNVAALAEGGVRFGDHHAVYPSHTRVNMSALASGTTPGRHGIVANTMLVAGATEDHIIDTSNYQHLDALGQFSGGETLHVPTLGEFLPDGGRVAVAGTGSGGSNLLWTHKNRGRIVNANTAFGIADLYDLREKLGEIPEAGYPGTARARYATRAVTDLYLDDADNRVIVLWLNEPDSSLHRFGLGS
ncbi:MAG: alkaline phosphatase family protein, partial [Chloroflexota bacterium]|nr:alkaline phosphatase family protein [Chloroflexota bacterium]